jgi:hypothetical protein
MRACLVWLLCSACTDSLGLFDLPTAPLRPELTAPFADNVRADNATYWTAEVHAAADAWNTALLAEGCDPMFRVSADPDEPAYAVTLYAYDRWPENPALVGLLHSGDLAEGAILIRNRTPTHSNLPTLIHELGHALGLPHDDSAGSAMTAKVGDLEAPAARDARAACR